MKKASVTSSRNCAWGTALACLASFPVRSSRLFNSILQRTRLRRNAVISDFDDPRRFTVGILGCFRLTFHARRNDNSHFRNQYLRLTIRKLTGVIINSMELFERPYGQ